MACHDLSDIKGPQRPAGFIYELFFPYIVNDILYDYMAVSPLTLQIFLPIYDVELIRHTTI